jgi:hypothetical protein
VSVIMTCVGRTKNRTQRQINVPEGSKPKMRTDVNWEGAFEQKRHTTGLKQG